MSASSQVELPPAPPETATHLLVCLSASSDEEARDLQTRLGTALPAATVTIAGSNDLARFAETAHVSAGQIVDGLWPLSSLDYSSAFQLATEKKATAALLLGADTGSLSPSALSALAAPLLEGTSDLTVSRPDLGPNDALVSSALLYPMTYALFGARAHLPMPPDAGFSLRFAQRLASASARTANYGGAFWPVSEAATASLRISEVSVGNRTLPRPTDRDLKSLLNDVLGSLFADLEAKANFWQRARAVSSVSEPADATIHELSDQDSGEIAAMIDGFRSAYDNLQEIWSLVLPPQSLLRIKRLSRTPANEFAFAPDLWARTSYDFLLAFHQRTINRGHLLGAFTPLYLAWVASHIRQSGGDETRASRHVETCADAFISEKPYLVSRWRWPDRFNP